MSKTRPIYMKFYVRDYLADTNHLTTEQHGIYMLLILYYWQHDGLPTDEVVLASIAGCTREQWERHRPVISQMFTKNWKHKRIEAEMKEAKELIQKRIEAGKKRWDKGRKVIPLKPVD